MTRFQKFEAPRRGIAPAPRVPHPSWRGDVPRDNKISVEEFWSRLDL